jgi:hypothetical protein
MGFSFLASGVSGDGQVPRFEGGIMVVQVANAKARGLGYIKRQLQ